MQGRIYLTVMPEDNGALPIYHMSTAEPPVSNGTVARVGSAFVYNEGNKSFSFAPFNESYRWESDGQYEFPVNFYLNLKTTEGTNGDLPIYSQFNPLAWHFTPSTTDIMHSPIWNSQTLTMNDWTNLSTGINTPNSLLGFAKGANNNNPAGHSHAIVKEIHRQPLFSVGQFMHTELGIFDTAPLYTVGNSYAPPFTGSYSDTVYSAGSNDRFGNEVNNADWSWYYNDKLFDKYFFSTIPDSNSEAPFSSIDQNFIYKDGVLANSRYQFYHKNNKPTSQEVSDLKDYDRAASQILIDGGFNVNSTSKTAWKLLLGSINTRISTLSPKYYDTTSGNELPFNSAWLYNLFRYNNPQGPAISESENNLNTNQISSWVGFRTISESELDDLATQIVHEVKKRGPFMNMSDFVNRRLENSDLVKKAPYKRRSIERSINPMKIVLEENQLQQVFGEITRTSTNLLRKKEADSRHGSCKMTY